jgi:GDP-L-fucose synthase
VRILLTGGSGMVGRNIREATEAAAHELLSPARNELDLTDMTSVRRYLSDNQPDMIVHAAGRVGGIQANIRNPVAFLVDNIDIGRNIVMGALEAGIQKFINLASSCMYPRNADNPLSEGMILTGELEPTNEGYAIAKIATMRLCQYINREYSNLAFKTLIPCNLYGRFDHFDLGTGHMVPAVIAKLHMARQQNADVVDIWGDGTARREFMYSGDLARAVWRAIDHFHDVPELMNIGLGYDYSINEYYRAIAGIVGYTGRFEHDLTRPAGMKQKLLDVSRMTDWGFTPTTGLDEGIAMAYDFFLQQHP